MTLNDELQEKLNALAFDRTDNFCYCCYKVVNAKNCPSCGSDDFMRHLEGVGFGLKNATVVGSAMYHASTDS